MINRALKNCVFDPTRKWGGNRACPWARLGEGTSLDVTVLWCLQEVQERGGRNSDQGKCSEPWQCCHKTYEVSAEWSCEPEGGFWSQCVITASVSLWSDSHQSLAGSRLPSHLCVAIHDALDRRAEVSAFWPLSDLGVNFSLLFSFSYLEINF